MKWVVVVTKLMVGCNEEGCSGNEVDSRLQWSGLYEVMKLAAWNNEVGCTVGSNDVMKLTVEGKKSEVKSEK